MAGPSFVSGSANAAASGSVTVTAPASIVSGNTLIAVLYDASSSAPSFTVPSGFTLAFGGSTVNTRGTMSIYTKTATGSEPGSYAFGGGHFLSVAVLQYTPCSLDGTPTTGNGASTSAVAPTITPANPSDTLLCAWGGFTGITISADPASMTRRAAASSAGNTSVTVDDETLSGTSATGTRTATWTTSSNYYSVSALLKGPATVAGVVAALSLAAPAGAVSDGIGVQAPVAAVSVAAPAGTVAGAVGGPAAGVSAAAPAGGVAARVSGAVTAVTVEAPAGTVSALVTPTFAAYDLDANASQAMQVAVTLSGVLEANPIPVPPPTHWVEAQVRARRLSLVMPDPTLDSRGRPT